MHAQNRLLEEASKKGKNRHFIFISDACIPVKSFDYIYETLEEEYSYFNMSPQEQCFPRCNEVLKYIEKEYIQKASQWCILNRKHAKIVMNSKYYCIWYESIFAADEHCYITKLFNEKLEKELMLTNHKTVDATTFINWCDMEYKYKSESGLKKYTYISKEELEYIVKSKSLFARKFEKECKSIYEDKKYLGWIEKK